MFETRASPPVCEWKDPAPARASGHCKHRTGSVEAPAYSLGRGERPLAGHELLYSAGNPTERETCTVLAGRNHLLRDARESIRTGPPFPAPSGQAASRATGDSSGARQASDACGRRQVWKNSYRARPGATFSMVSGPLQRFRNPAQAELIGPETRRDRTGAHPEPERGRQRPPALRTERARALQTQPQPRHLGAGRLQHPAVTALCAVRGAAHGQTVRLRRQLEAAFRRRFHEHAA